ncbi:MAG: hypothetical protein M3O30_01645 [Planctomycetota bacterium]|nr:hypothetical protein [Planctomycetota bacterium]
MSNTGNDKLNLGTVSTKVYALLIDLEQKDRTRVINSVLQLFGDTVISGTPLPIPGGTPAFAATDSAVVLNRPALLNPQEFYAQKEPKNKGEMLAVAARYREQYLQAPSHQLADFATFFADARQNFDRKNFGRDIKNAQRQAALFNIGTPSGQYRLSHRGQQYVDALPSRELLKKLKRPRIVKGMSVKK